MRRYSTGVILSIVYGRRGPSWKGVVSDLYEVMDPWSESKLGSPPLSRRNAADMLPFIVVETGATPPMDIFPWIKKLPNFLSPWRKKAQKVRQMELDVRGSAGLSLSQLASADSHNFVRRATSCTVLSPTKSRSAAPRVSYAIR